MFVIATREMGVACKVSADTISGQIVKITEVSPFPPGERTCAPISASGDISSGVMWGLAYYDPLRFSQEQPEGGATFAALVPSITSPPNPVVAKVALAHRVTVLHGRFRGWTDQLDDGTYGPGLYLTINPATARLKPAASGDRRYARVELLQKPKTVTAQNDGVMIVASMPEGLVP